MKWKPYANVAIAVFVGFQLLYPIRGLMADKFDTWGAFTWNMYSRTYGCKGIYYLEQPDGRQHNIDLRRYFRRSSKMGRVFHRDVLPTFNEWLCEQMEIEGSTGVLKATLECWMSEDERQGLVAPDTEICTTPDFGLVPDSS